MQTELDFAVTFAAKFQKKILTGTKKTQIPPSFL
jgi:hypothetical protein